jgi:cytoskeletal protein RodZ
VAVTGDPKWHERTPTLLAASVAALAAIGLIVWLTMFVVRQVDTTEPAPTEYMTPFDDSSSSAAPTTGSTTSTITSTKPVETTDISDVIGPPSSSSSSSPSRTRTRTSTERARPGDDEEDETTTTRRRARQNETRTLYPRP